MKYINLLVFLMFFGLSQLNAQNNETKNAYFRIDSATKFIVYSSDFNGNGLIQYEVYITLTSDEIKSIDSAWANLKGASVIIKVPKNMKKLNFKKNKTFHLIISFPTNTDLKPELPNFKNLPPEPCLDLLIRIKLNNNNEYVCVNQIKLIPFN